MVKLARHWLLRRSCDGVPWNLAGRFGQQAELDGEHDQLLLGAVVQVPLDPAAFGVLGLNQPAPGREQLVDGGPQLGGELLGRSALGHILRAFTSR